MSGGYELCFSVLLKGANNFEIGHVLTSCVVAAGGGDQPAAAVNDIRRKATAADFLQTANQELHVLNRRNHA